MVPSDRSAFPAKRRSGPLVLPWPARDNPISLITFDDLNDWQRFVGALSLPTGVPKVVAEKYKRAQKLYYLAWIDGDLVKAGELAAVIALELALRDRYGQCVKSSKKKLSLHSLLNYMVLEDGLTDAKLPLSQFCGGSIVANLTGTFGISGWRNSLAHGDPFDAAPIAGLLQIVRDLIAYAYRASSSPN